MKRIALLATVAIACTFSACKKDKDKDAPKTKTDMLVDKNWKVTAATAEFMGQSIDIYSQIGACSQDDIQRFAKPNTYTYDEGATKCSSSDPQTTSGTWAFDSNETKLVITESGSSESADIEELTETTLKISQTETLQGQTVKYHLTMTKQ